MKLDFYADSYILIGLDNGDDLIVDIKFNDVLKSLELSLISDGKILYKRDSFNHLYHSREFEIEIITDIMPDHKAYRICLSRIKNSAVIHMEIDEIEHGSIVVDFSDNKDEEEED